MTALTAVENVARSPSADVLAERIEDEEKARDDLSRRLRLEIDELRRRFDDLQSRPFEVDKIRFPPRMVAAIVMAILSIVLGMYGATWGVRTDVSDIKAAIANREQIDVLQRKLSEQQTDAFAKKIDEFDKRQQLQAIQVQELKEMVLKQGVK